MTNLSFPSVFSAGYYCDNQQRPVTDFTLYPCPQGFYCPPGTKRSTQYSCPVGTFGPRQKLKTVKECQSCPPGKYCELSGLAAPTGTVLFCICSQQLESCWRLLAAARDWSKDSRVLFSAKMIYYLLRTFWKEKTSLFLCKNGEWDCRAQNVCWSTCPNTEAVLGVSSVLLFRSCQFVICYQFCTPSS